MFNTKDDPAKPNYYCAAQHRYVSIPGDFPDVAAAEKACEYDHGKDCDPKKPPKPGCD